MKVANTLPIYDTATMMAVKGFIVQALKVNRWDGVLAHATMPRASLAHVIFAHWY